MPPRRFSREDDCHPSEFPPLPPADTPPASSAWPGQSSGASLVASALPAILPPSPSAPDQRSTVRSSSEISPQFDRMSSDRDLYRSATWQSSLRHRPNRHENRTEHSLFSSMERAPFPQW